MAERRGCLGIGDQIRPELEEVSPYVPGLVNEDRRRRPVIFLWHAYGIKDCRVLFASGEKVLIMIDIKVNLK